jgi:hypothetical protein
VGGVEKRAKGPGTEPPYPVAVLVNGSSASASEIVAGALKNNDRALIVGQQTFGKGSVQLVFPDITPEKAALKLTIAQYLTPGDISIQGVGVTPDIALEPMTVDELEMDLTVHKDGIRERDLSAHLSNSRAAPAGKPTETVRYQFSKTEREGIRDRGGEIEDEFTMDFPIKTSRRRRRRPRSGSTSSTPSTSSSRRRARTRSRRSAPTSRRSGSIGPTRRPIKAKSRRRRTSRSRPRPIAATPRSPPVSRWSSGSR